MSLLKQLFLAICLFLVVAFTGSFIASVESSREQSISQLRSHAQDAATALGLSLTPHVDDPAMIELMVSSIFDSGYFASIRVVRIADDSVIVERSTEIMRASDAVLAKEWRRYLGVLGSMLEATAEQVRRELVRIAAQPQGEASRPPDHESG